MRRFQDEDAEEVSILTHKTLNEVNAKVRPLEEIEALASKQTPANIIKRSKLGDIFVAVKRSSIVGTVSLIENEIKTLYVHHEHQNEGIGTSLLEYIEKFAKKKGLKNIIVFSGIFAQKFYEHHGYTLTKEVFHEIDNTRYKVYQMEKQL